VQGNKKELEDLKAKLEAILSIVEKYKEHDGLCALSHRIEIFCESVAFSCPLLSCLYPSMLCSAVTHELDSVKEMQNHSLFSRTAEGTKDADTILKAFRNISNLCERFQVGFFSSYSQSFEL
jgi:hypothetical protein